jgi:hypothetical protein
MKRVAAHSVAHDFGKDWGATTFREFELFQDQNAGAFADDKSIPLAIEGAGGMGRIAVPL